jgi:hypothetical protein
MGGSGAGIPLSSPPPFPEFKGFGGLDASAFKPPAFPTPAFEVPAFGVGMFGAGKDKDKPAKKDGAPPAFEVPAFGMFAAGKDRDKPAKKDGASPTPSMGFGVFNPFAKKERDRGEEEVGGFPMPGLFRRPDPVQETADFTDFDDPEAGDTETFLNPAFAGRRVNEPFNEPLSSEAFHGADSTMTMEQPSPLMSEAGLPTSMAGDAAMPFPPQPKLSEEERERRRKEKEAKAVLPIGAKAKKKQRRPLELVDQEVKPVRLLMGGESVLSVEDTDTLAEFEKWLVRGIPINKMSRKNNRVYPRVLFCDREMRWMNTREPRSAKEGRTWYMMLPWYRAKVKDPIPLGLMRQVRGAKLPGGATYIRILFAGGNSIDIRIQGDADLFDHLMDGLTLLYLQYGDRLDSNEGIQAITAARWRLKQKFKPMGDRGEPFAYKYYDKQGIKRLILLGFGYSLEDLSKSVIRGMSTSFIRQS